MYPFQGRGDKGGMGFRVAIMYWCSCIFPPPTAFDLMWVNALCEGLGDPSQECWFWPDTGIARAVVGRGFVLYQCLSTIVVRDGCGEVPPVSVLLAYMCKPLAVEKLRLEA